MRHGVVLPALSLAMLMACKLDTYSPHARPWPGDADSGDSLLPGDAGGDSSPGDACAPALPAQVDTPCASVGGVVCGVTEICAKRPFAASDTPACCPSGNCFVTSGRLLAEAVLTPTGAVLDGERNDWVHIPRHGITKLVHGALPSSPEDLSARFGLQWSSAGLFILVEVTDDVRRPADGPQVHNDDSIEVYVDMAVLNPQKAYNSDESEGQMWALQSNQVQENQTRNWNAEARFVPDGVSSWFVEFYFPWPTSFSVPSPGDLIGLDVAVNDDDGEGGDLVRECQLAWNDPTGNLYRDARHFGLVRLRPDECQSQLPLCGDNQCDGVEACQSCSTSIPWCFDLTETTDAVCPSGQCVACPADCGACL